MTSKIKVDNINKVSDDSNIIKKCGTTTTIGSGASNPIVVDGSAITLGRCGGTVALASGATQTGFGRTGTVDWQTTPKTATFTAVSGEGYFANTTGSAFNMNLPAGVAGAIVSVADYAATFQTTNLTVVPNGTDKIGSIAQNAKLNTEGQSVTFVFVDSTQGWINTMDSTSNVRGTPPFIAATGGTISCEGDYKIHTFTSPGTFQVTNLSPVSANNQVDYLVVAGGGAGGGPLGGDSAGGGGGGAGGFRVSNDTCMPAPLTSPLANPTGITATIASFPITVGAGGTPNGNPPGAGGNGSNSIFSTITSTGGGGGGGNPCSPAPLRAGQPGGSGGGAGRAPGGPNPGGTGNTPPVSPSQGNPGGDVATCGSAPNYGQGGGGGAGSAGNLPVDQSSTVGGSGGIGSFVLATGFAGSNGTTGPVSSTRYFAGGGGGSTYQGGTPGPGGAGGGGAGNNAPNNPSSPGISGVSGGTNTGGGGGGMSQQGTGGAGGSGIVIIRYKFQ